MTDPATLDGTMVSARAIGWDSGGSSEWALDSDDLPRMTRLIGPLIVNYVEDLDYTQYVVNGIPVDPSTVSGLSLPGQVLIASAPGVCDDCGLPEMPAEFKQLDVGRVPRSNDGRWCKGSGCQSGGSLESTDDPAKFAKKSPDVRVSAPEEWFASESEWQATQDLANEKARNVPKPSREQIAKNKEQARRAKEEGKRAGGELRGNSYTRRARGEALFEQFGGLKKKFVPCTHCGIKTSPKGRGGFAPMEQDKILTLNEGGGYGTPKNFPNLIPSCSGCNKSRGESPYPVRPSWSGGGLSVLRANQFRITEAEASDRLDDEVVAFPLYWDEPWYDGPDGPVQGLLGKREVTAFWGRYTQWIVGNAVIDPAHIYDVDDPLVASGSAMCMDCGGWLPGLVAAGGSPEPVATKVPRDPSGKWCKGLQCQGQLQIGGLESEVEGPSLSGVSVEYDQMSPGQKAAHTKKMKKAAAQEAAAKKAAEEAVIQQAIDGEASAKIANNEPLAPKAHEAMSDELVDDYLDQNMSASKKPSSMDEKRELVGKMNEQHELDQLQLKNEFGYQENKSPRESRRTVMRETGERRPTGGPNPGNEHVFYSDSQIEDMPREKKIGLISHHSGGLAPGELDGESDESLTSLAKGRNNAYKSQVQDLRQQGYDDSQIGHSAYSTSNMQAGFAPGMKGNPPKNVISTAPGGTGKPANWDQMSPGKKAAWTKKQNKLGGGKPDGPPKPPEWDSWGAGQKAAWTKGQNLKGASMQSSGSLPLGKRTEVVHQNPATARMVWNGKMSSIKLSESGGTGGPTSRTKQRQANEAFRQNLTQQEKQAVDWYAGSGYQEINGVLKRGNAPTPSTDNAIARMDTAAQKGPLAPSQMLRGKHRGPLADMNYQVGDVYEEPGYGSFSVDTNVPLNSLFGGTGDRRVITKVVRTNGVRQIPGNKGESEAIMPRGTKYRVLSIEDHVSPAGSGSGPQHFRYLEVEIVP